MGRIVRACAEIEDIINLRLARLSGAPDGLIMMFLGRTSVSRKLETLKLLSAGKGGEATRLFAEAFETQEYKALSIMRNTIAHGWLLGQTKEGMIAFAVVEIQGLNDTQIQSTVHTYAPESFEIMAGIAERAIPQMEEAFGLRALRETRRAQDLGPHNKGQPQKSKGVKPESPRQALQRKAREEKLARKEAQRADPRNRKPKD